MHNLLRAVMFYFWVIIYSYLPCFYVLFSALEEFYLQEI